MVARAILVQAKEPRPLQKSLKTMPSKRRFPRVPLRDAPAWQPPAKILATLNARLDAQSEEIAELMNAAGLTRVSDQDTERSKMMEHFDKTREECNRIRAGMNLVLEKNGAMLKERHEKIEKMLEKVRECSVEALQEARAVKASLKNEKADIQKAVMDLKGLDAKLTECFKKSMGRVDALQAELEDTATNDAKFTTDLDKLTARVINLEKRSQVKNLLKRQTLQNRVDEIGGQLICLAQNVASQEMAEQADGGHQSGGLCQEIRVCKQAAALMRTRCRSHSPKGRSRALAPLCALASAHVAAPASDLASAPVSDHVAATGSADLLRASMERT